VPAKRSQIAYMRGVCTAGQQHHRLPVVLLASTVRAPFAVLQHAFDFLATQVLPQVREPDLSRCSVLL
jgi:hypothetical protein